VIAPISAPLKSALVGPRATIIPSVVSLPLTPPMPAPRPASRIVQSPESSDWRPIAPVTRVSQEPEPKKNPVTPPRIEEEPPSKPLTPPRVLPESRPADQPKKLDVPRTLTPAESELPVAPPELMAPPGVVLNKHHSFGSAPIRLSRDYPTLHELFECLHPDGGRLTDPPGSPVADRLQFQGEFLLWHLNAAPIPILATTTVAPGTAPNQATGNGFLGDPATRIVLGPGPFGNGQRPGFRVRAGWWQDECGTCGIDGSVFALGRKTASESFTSPGSPVLTRPFFSPNTDAATGAVIGETGEIVAFPNFASGSLNVQATSVLWGADANFRKALCRTCDFQAFGFVGYRFLSLSETLTIGESLTSNGPKRLRSPCSDTSGTNDANGNPDAPTGTFSTVEDSFAAKNWFHGGQIGGAMERNWGRVSLDLRGSIALGVTHQQLDISGIQTKLLPGMTTPTSFQGGLLAVGPNLGRFTQDKFSVVPEGTGNVGFWVTPSLKVYAGYNVVYWSNVIRPGNQIDRVVDVRFVPNPPPGFISSGQNRPLALFSQSDVWIRGVQFGFEWRW